jgi:hypothetical protein
MLFKPVKKQSASTLSFIMRKKKLANVFFAWNKLHLCFSGQNSEAHVKTRIPRRKLRSSGNNATQHH